MDTTSMDITLQPIGGYKPAVITHDDFPYTEKRGAFTTAHINLGDDTITIFLPYMGRLTYTTENKE